MTKSSGCGIRVKKERECGIRTPPPPPPPPFQTLFGVTIIFTIYEEHSFTS